MTRRALMLTTLLALPGASCTSGSHTGERDTGHGEPCLDIDADGHCHDLDCDDLDAAIHPSSEEACANALDDDCDGLVDEGCLDASRRFYVDRDSLGGPCSDDNPGTEAAPWCTIARANAALGAGDTAWIRAGTYTGETIQPERSGTSSTERVAYAAYPGEEPVLTGSVYCVRLQARSHVTVLGLRFEDCERNLYMADSSHNIIGHCSFDNPSGPATWAGSRIYDGSTHNLVHDCTFSRYGSEAYYGDSYQDYGAILDIGNDNEDDDSDGNLVIRNTFSYGGHHILGVYSSHNVVRANTFHNEEWYPCHRDAIGGLCGNRDIILNTSQPDGNTHNVIEDNRIAAAGVPPDQDSSTGLSVRTRSNIVRRNALYDCDSAGAALSVDGGNHNDASDNHVYHNVFHRNGYPLLDDWDPRKTGLMLARWVDDEAHNPMTGVAIRNNVFHENQLYAVYFYYVDELEQDVADNWEGGEPGFAAVPDPSDPSSFSPLHYHLEEDSPCIDNGGFLTRTTGDGHESTSLAVEDAGFFTDGHGLVGPDLVQLEGQSTAVAIAAIDREANTLTLQAPLTWAEGTGVSLPYGGSRPDQGLHEYRAP